MGKNFNFKKFCVNYPFNISLSHIFISFHIKSSISLLFYEPWVINHATLLYLPQNIPTFDFAER